MGLDMYLYARATRTKYNFDEEANSLSYEGPFKRFEALQKATNFLDVETNCQIGYWRKFNALHKYIVDKFAEGVDECQRIELRREDIEHILEVLKKITPETAMELLPPADGFFFGSQEIDEWYLEDVAYSITVFEAALEFLNEEIYRTVDEAGDKSWELNEDNPYKDYKYRSIYYEASW